MSMNPDFTLLDQHIRGALKNKLRMQDSKAAIIDELPLMRGRGRADLAFVNGSIVGFEIKSEKDSLVRLGSQASNYESVFEFSSVVAAQKHIPPALEKLPPTWGIVEVVNVEGEIELHTIRRPTRNHHLDNAALARLLWKSECARILRRLHFDFRAQAPVVELWKLMEEIETARLCAEVRDALKARQVKVVPLHTQCGD